MERLETVEDDGRGIKSGTWRTENVHCPTVIEITGLF